MSNQMKLLQKSSLLHSLCAHDRRLQDEFNLDRLLQTCIHCVTAFDNWVL